MIQANILQFEIITKEKIALCSQVSLKYVTKKGDDLIGHPLFALSIAAVYPI